MFSAFEWMLATRYLRARRSEGFISVIAGFSFLGIMLGVATLIIVMSVMNGFRAELLGRILGLNGHYLVQGNGQPLEDYDAVAGRIRGVEGIVRVTPMVEGQAMASAHGVGTGAMVRGLRPADLAGHDILSTNIRSGSLSDFGGKDTLVIGQRLANKLGVAVGDRLNLISPKGTTTAFGMVPRVLSYRVVATFDIGMYEYDAGYVFMPLQAAQTYFRMGKGVTGLEVMTEDADRALALRGDILDAAAAPIRLFDWQQSNAGFFNALQVERNVMFLILTLIILVAAFNIISSMIMLVKDKGRGIAILRTMGATRGMILRVFFMAGASVGVVGTFSGFLLGLGFCANIDRIKGWLESLTGVELFSAEIYFLSHLPAKVDTGEVVMVVSMALLLSFAATIYPAWRAARLDPVEALRYE